MEQAALEQFRNRLLAEKENLENDLKEFAVEDPKAAGGWKTKFPSYGNRTSEQDENADEVEEYAADLSIEQQLEKRLSNIILALKKMDEGTYGACEKCKNSIDVERLKVNPEARLCMNCAESK